MIVNRCHLQIHSPRLVSSHVGHAARHAGLHGARLGARHGAVPQGVQAHVSSACAFAQCVWKAVSFVLFPRGCAGCDAPDEVLCRQCTEEFRQHPVRPVSAPVRSGEVWACAWYRGSARQAVLRWKDHGDEEADAPLCALLRELVQHRATLLRRLVARSYGMARDDGMAHGDGMAQAGGMAQGSGIARSGAAHGFGIPACRSDGICRVGGSARIDSLAVPDGMAQVDGVASAGSLARACCSANDVHAGDGHAGDGHAGDGHAGDGHAGDGHAGDRQADMNRSRGLPPILVVPVPSSAESKRARGRFQTKTLAKAVAAQLRVCVSEAVYADVLDLHGVFSKSVVASGRDDRAARIRGRVRVKRDADLRSPVILVDDIVTSGATIRECVKALHRHGADVVAVFTLAAVPLRTSGDGRL